MTTRRRALVFDGLLGLAVWVSVSWLITADQAGDRTPDALAYLWALGLGCLLLVRRRYPLLVLWVTVAALFAYYLAGYPAVGLSVPAAGALLTAAELCRLRWPLLAAGVLVVVSYAARILQGQDLTRILGYELVGHLGLMAAAIALGVSLRLRRDLQERTAELVTAVREREQSEAAAVRAAERTAIARDLHDALGHRAAVVSIHAEVAADALAGRPDDERGESVSDPSGAAARAAIDTIRETTEEMMADLRATVRSLREGSRSGGGPAGAGGSAEGDTELPGAGTAARTPVGLGTLAGMVRRLPISVDLRLAAPVLSAPVEAAAVRIVQEALTNVMRHSAAHGAEVAMWAENDRPGSLLRIRVADAGPARRRDRPHGTTREAAADDSEAGAAGAGIRGMRERARALGGRLTAASHGTGFRVDAELPLGDAGVLGEESEGVCGEPPPRCPAERRRGGIGETVTPP